jgi:hypothetical protein
MAPRARIAALLAALAAPVAAQAIDALDSLDGPAPPPSMRRHDAPRLPPAVLAALPKAPRAEAGSPLSRLTVVELPPESSLPGARRHHALSIPLDSARGAARSLGIDASACALQLRMPSRLAREMAAGARTTVDVQAQVRLACAL